MQSAMQTFVARFASKDPLMQSAMQTFVARFASGDPRICGGTDAKGITSIDRVSICVCGSSNSGVLQLRFRMTAKNKQRPKTSGGENKRR